VIRSFPVVKLEKLDGEARLAGLPRRAFGEPETERRGEPLGRQIEIACRGGICPGPLAERIVPPSPKGACTR
jgi:hypothetical protein